MVKTVKWSFDTQTWCTDASVRVNEHNVLFHGSVELVQYCAKKCNNGIWIATFAKKIDADDIPAHCATFPFPFMLPIYPKSTIWIVGFKCGEGALQEPFTLGETQVEVEYVDIDLTFWDEVCSKIEKELENDDATYTFLQKAFDPLWKTDDALVDDDFVADDDVATDLLLQSSFTTVAQAPAALAFVQPPNTDEDWNEEDAIVDVRTGLVVGDAQSLLSPTVSEDEDNDGSDEDEENDDDDDVEEDDEEDEEDVTDDIEMVSMPNE